MKYFKRLFLILLVSCFCGNALALGTVKLGPQYFPMTDKGKPVSLGSVYVGQPDTDPSILANQKQLSVQQESGTIVAVTQPISTSAGGIPLYLGSPVTLLVEGTYSLKILDSSDAQIYYVPSASSESSGTTSDACYPSYAAVDQGLTGDNDTLKYCIDTIGADQATIVLRHNSGSATTTYTLTTSETLPDNITLKFERGAVIDGAGTLTINGSIDAGNYQIFGSSLTATGSPNINEVNIKWFGATGDGATDDAAAIQKAVDFVTNTTVIFPIGNYFIESTINVDSINKIFLNLKGFGAGSKITWNGAADLPMIYYNGGSNSAFATIEGLQFFNGIKESDTVTHGVVGLRIGRKLGGVTGAYGTCNVTISKNQFQFFDTAIEIWNESDQITISDNYIFVVTSYGILATTDPACTTGCGNGAVRVLNNHILGPQAGAVGVKIRGSVPLIIGNVIQAVTLFDAITLDYCNGFRVTGNYSEGHSAGASDFLNISNTSSGYVGENEIGGYASGIGIDIAATAHDINIGSNFFAVSGGPMTHIAIAAGAKGINILGTQYSSTLTDNTITGTPDFVRDGDGNTTTSGISRAQTFTSEAAFLNIAVGATTTFFTISGIPSGGAYLVSITQGVESYSTTAMVTVAEGSVTAVATNIYRTNANLDIAISGLEIQAFNGTGSTRTVTYSVVRIL
jgi:hypothetical protein